MFSSTQLVSLSQRAPHFLSQAARSASASASSRRSPRSGLAGRRAGSGPAQLLQAVVVRLARQVVQRVPQEVDVAALDEGSRQDLAERRLEPGVVVSDRELDAVQAPLLQPEQEV